MSGTPIIDLDQPTPTHATPRWPLAYRLRRAERPGRALLVAALTAGLLLALPGGPLPPRATLVLTVDAETFQLGQDRLYSIQPAAAGDSAVTAHDLATGEVSWRTPTPHGSGLVTSVVEAGVLVTSWLPPTHPDAPAVTTSLHPGTGAVRWTAPGALASLATAAIVLNRSELDAPSSEYLVVAPETGEVRWRFESASAFTIDEEADRLLRVVDEELVSHRLTTGELTAGAPLPTGQSVELVSASGSPVLVRAEGPDGISLHAFDAQLSPIWRAQLSEGLQSPHVVMSCGDLICFVAGDTVSALDPRDGAVRWVADDLPLTGLSQYPAVVGEAPHKLLTFTSRTSDGGGQTILSLASGAVVHAWSDWRVIPKASREPGDREPGDQPMAAVGQDPSTGETWAGLYDVDHSRFHPLAPMGTAAPPSPYCVGDWPYLYCWEEAGTTPTQVSVWLLTS